MNENALLQLLLAGLGGNSNQQAKKEETGPGLMEIIKALQAQAAQGAKQPAAPVPSQLRPQPGFNSGSPMSPIEEQLRRRMLGF